MNVLGSVVGKMFEVAKLMKKTIHLLTQNALGCPFLYNSTCGKSTDEKCSWKWELCVFTH